MVQCFYILTGDVIKSMMERLAPEKEQWSGKMTKLIIKVVQILQM